VEPAIVASARRRIDYTFQVDAAADLQTLGWSTQAGYLKQAPVAAALFDLRYLPHP
jgi:NitT/TauT family transport system substrate-binding protein